MKQYVFLIKRNTVLVTIIILLFNNCYNIRTPVEKFSIKKFLKSQTEFFKRILKSQYKVLMHYLPGHCDSQQQNWDLTNVFFVPVQIQHENQLTCIFHAF